MLQHPSSPVHFDQPAARADAGAVAAAKAAQTAERAAVTDETGITFDGDRPVLPPADDGELRFSVSPLADGLTPFLERVLHGDLAGDLCVCGLKIGLHFDDAGCLWIGCTGALNHANGHADGG